MLYFSIFGEYVIPCRFLETASLVLKCEFHKHVILSCKMQFLKILFLKCLCKLKVSALKFWAFYLVCRITPPFYSQALCLGAKVFTKSKNVVYRKCLEFYLTSLMGLLKNKKVE